MSATRRPGYFAFIVEEEPVTVEFLDQLADLGECEHLSDDARELIRRAVGALMELLPDTR